MCSSCVMWCDVMCAVEFKRDNNVRASDEKLTIINTAIVSILFLLNCAEHFSFIVYPSSMCCACMYVCTISVDKLCVGGLSICVFCVFYCKLFVMRSRLLLPKIVLNVMSARASYAECSAMCFAVDETKIMQPVMHVLRIHFGDNLQTFEFIFAECWNNNWKRARPTNPMDEIEFLLVLCVIVFIMTVVFTRCQQISTPLFYFSLFFFL